MVSILYMAMVDKVIIVDVNFTQYCLHWKQWQLSVGLFCHLTQL